LGTVNTGAVAATASRHELLSRLDIPLGGPRLARHLWRMCFALFIAAGSFFSIRARVAKNPSGAAHDCADTRAGDPAVVCAMFFWLWRVRGRRTMPVLGRHDSIPLVTRAT
jgi:hypothetical protein